MKYRCSGRLRKHRDGTAYCDYEASEPWKGRCPGCGRPYSILKERPQEDASRFSLASLADIKPPERLPTGCKEFDYILGGGLVVGSTLVLTGPPGQGKTTLLLQASKAVAEHTGRPVLYASGEQNSDDLGIYAQRLGVNSAGIIARPNEGDCYKITAEAERLKPAMIVIDSIQTAFISDVGGDVGSAEQIKAVCNWMTSHGKVEKVTNILVCHVNKEGDLSGPRTLEFLVDAIAYLEPYFYESDDEEEVDEEFIASLRDLNIGKNRFSRPGLKAIVQMTEHGIKTPERPVSGRLVV